MRKTKKILSVALMGWAAVQVSPVVAFGFDFGDSFGEGFDFNEGNDLDIGGSRMSWESPDNAWDTGTSSGKGFSWGGGPRSGPNWGFRDAPPPAYWSTPPQYAAPYYRAPEYMPQPYYNQPPAPRIYSRPPAPSAPASTSVGSGEGDAQ